MEANITEQVNTAPASYPSGRISNPACMLSVASCGIRKSLRNFVIRGLVFIGFFCITGVADSCLKDDIYHTNELAWSLIPVTGQCYCFVVSELEREGKCHQDEKTRIEKFVWYGDVSECNNGADHIGVEDESSPAYSFNNLNVDVAVIGETTDTDGFMSLYEFKDKLYAGTYATKRNVSIYSYPEWKKEASLDLGESLFAFKEFNGSLFAVTEDKNKLLKSINGTHYEVIFEAENNLGLGINVFKDKLYIVYTEFDHFYKELSDAKGPTLYVSSDGNNFTEVNWALAKRGECTVYDLSILNDRLYVPAYCDSYKKTEIWVSSDGKTWTKNEDFTGIKAILQVDGITNKLYGYTDSGSGTKLIEYDGTNTIELIDLPDGGGQMLGFKGDLYILTTRADFKAASDNSAERAKLVKYDFNNNSLSLIHVFGEPVATRIREFNGSIYVATKDHSTTNHGKIYRIDIKKR